jgi:ATP-dependent Clp protease ATP-binding subunit ClpC
LFERFTEAARQVVVSAQDEARGLRHDYIGTEHLLLGLLRDEGIAARVLLDLSVRPDEVRAQVVHLIGRGKTERANGGHIPLTPRARKTLELALREALQLGDGYVGSEHVLLGLARLNEGVGPVILAGAGATAPRVAAAVVEARGGSVPSGYVDGFSEEEPSTTKVVAAHRTGLLVFGGLVFALASGLGILVGWLVWGL